MNLVDLYKASHHEFGRRVAEVGRDQWRDPTPCTEWDVHDLVNHMVYEARWTPHLMRGSTIEEVGDRFEGDLLGDDAKAAWEDASHDAIAAVSEPGALGRTVHVSWGRIPAQDYVMQLTNDHAIHAWDLARAIGADEALPQGLVETLWEWADARRDQIMASGVYGEPVDVPDDADMQRRLLALLGRKA